MRRLASAVLLVLLAGRASGEPWIDYELVLEQNASKVVKSKDDRGRLVRSIDFGDSLTVRCTGQSGHAACFGMDRSQKGGTGCLFVILHDLQDIARDCPGIVTAPERDRIEEFYEMVGTYVADNAVPRMGWSELRDKMASVGAGQTKPQCESVSDPEMVVWIQQLVAPANLEAFKNADRPSRLPVTNPCL